MNELQFIINETILDHSPDGWDSNVLEFDRSPEYLGIIRSFTIQLKFTLDGAELLRDIFYSKTGEETTFTIQKLHPITLVYETIYTGIFDMSTFNDSDYFVSVKVVDNGLAYLVKKNIEKEYQPIFTTSHTFKWNSSGSLIRPTEFIFYSEWLYKLMDKVTDGKIVSGVFGLDMSELTAAEATSYFPVLTSSCALSGGGQGPVKLSLKELLKSIFVLFDLVIAIEKVAGKQTLILLKTSDTFPALSAFTIENLSEVKISPANDYLFDSISVGFPDQDDGEATDETDEIYKFNEVCATSKFTNESDFIVNKPLELISDIRADIRGIKKYYALYGTPDYTDFTLFSISLVVVSSLYQAENGTVTIDSTEVSEIPNIRISPKRLLLKHESFINSCFYGSSDNVFFNSAPFNISLATTQQYADIQNEGVGFTRTEDALFVPLLIDFEGTLPEGIDLNTLSHPTLSRVKFNYRDTDFEGFIINMKVGLIGKLTATVKLLCSPDNDLSKLIR